MSAQQQVVGATHAPGASGAEPGTSCASGSCTVRCFSEVTPSDGRLDFQIVDLGRQLYVWVAVGGAKLSSMCFSIQAPSGGGAPSTAVLMRGGAGASGEGLAQRLALRLGRPVLCSCNLPQDAGLLQAVAERRLLRELDDMARNGVGSSGDGAGGGLQQVVAAANATT